MEINTKYSIGQIVYTENYTLPLKPIKQEVVGINILSFGKDTKISYYLSMLGDFVNVNECDIFATIEEYNNHKEEKFRRYYKAYILH